MGTEQSRTVSCNDCGAVLEEPTDLPPDHRAPCPVCGSTIRHVKITLAETVTLRESLGLKLRDGEPGKVAPHLEVRTGDSYTWKTGKWNKREVRVDRKNDWYDEVVTDAETGQIIHECHEPLSAHQGHGGAKRKGGPA